MPSATPTHQRSRWLIWLLAAVVLNLLALSPMLSSGYIGDDTLNSQLPGTLILEGLSLWNFLVRSCTDWISQGRLFPLAFYGSALYATFPHLWQYKTVVLSLVAIDLLAFGYLIRLLTGHYRWGVAAVAIMPALFQFRFYHDPILSYHGLLEVVFLYTLLSLIFLYKALEDDRRGFYVVSMLLYLAGLLTYEITLAFFPLHMLLVAMYPSRKPLRKAFAQGLPFLVLAVGTALASIAVRAIYKIPVVSSTPSGAYVANLDLGRVAGTTLRQIVAALPLNYFLVDPHHVFSSALQTLPQRLGWLPVVLALGLAVVFLRMVARKDELAEDQPNGGKLLLLGVCLMAVPAPLIALSPKYQTEVVWGIGYLPVFISHFGVAMALLGLLAFLRSRASKAAGHAIVAFALLVSMVSVLNFLNNRQVVDGQNSHWRFPRETIETALHQGLLSALPSSARLFIDTRWPWETPAFYTMHTGRKFDFVGIHGQFMTDPALPQAPKFAYAYPPDAPTYYLRYDTNANQEGYVVLGQARSLVLANTVLYSAVSDRIRLFVHHMDPKQLTLTGLLVDPAHNGATTSLTVEPSALRAVAQGKDWTLLELPGNGKLIDMKALNVNGLSSNLKQSTDWRFKSPQSLRLGMAPDSLLHVGFQDGNFGPGVEFNPLDVGQTFTIEAVVKPEASQVGYSGIIGNHPGYSNFEGFVLQQDVDKTNTYILGLGNGREWVTGPTVTLTPGHWQYLALVVDQPKGKARAYIDGKEVSVTSLPAPLRPSGMPLYVGNWLEGTRMFNGRIDEVRILKEALGPDQIRANWQRVGPP